MLVFVEIVKQLLNLSKLLKLLRNLVVICLLLPASIQKRSGKSTNQSIVPRGVMGAARARCGYARRERVQRALSCGRVADALALV